MGKFEIKKRGNGEFQFNLKAGNGQIIMSSEGYAAKASCMGGIESVRKNASREGSFERGTSSSGKFFFRLKATNGQVIGTSEMYESEAARDNGIDSVMRNADSPIDDTTV